MLAAVKHRRPAARRTELAITALVVGVPTLGTVAALVHAWTWGMTALDVGLFFGFYAVSILGITLGFHRLFTHASYKAHPALRVALAIAGSLALQGPVIRWVADHRRHHAFSDKDGDPHSPVDHGLWHAHFGWMWSSEATVVRRFAPDLLDDELVKGCDRLYPLWALVSLGAPALIGGAVGGPEAALSGLLWGGFARVFFAHHATWAVNSIAHRFGPKHFRTRDESRNNALIALLTFGEGWHNNHHAFPTSARHGLLPGQPDPTATLIDLFVWLGWAHDVHTPTERQLANRSLK